MLSTHQVILQMHYFDYEEVFGIYCGKYHNGTITTVPQCTSNCCATVHCSWVPEPDNFINRPQGATTEYPMAMVQGAEQ